MLVTALNRDAVSLCTVWLVMRNGIPCTSGAATRLCLWVDGSSGLCTAAAKVSTPASMAGRGLLKALDKAASVKGRKFS